MCVLSLLCLMNSQAIRRKKKKRKEQVPDTFHQQPSIYTLRLLACHSISHSVDYTPRGARGENHTGNPILCHIKCQGRSFRFSVITTETAGGEAEGAHCGGGGGGGERMKVSGEVIRGGGGGVGGGGWRESQRCKRHPYWSSFVYKGSFVLSMRNMGNSVSIPSLYLFCLYA